MNDPITRFNLLLVALGLSLISVSFHYRKEGTKLEYGLFEGFVTNLTVKGKFVFYAGLILEILGLLY